jgi:para-aminobenzoate synthetase component 1
MQGTSPSYEKRHANQAPNQGSHNSPIQTPHNSAIESPDAISNQFRIKLPSPSVSLYPVQLTPDQLSLLRKNAPAWAARFDRCMVLDSHNAVHACNLHRYELLIAAGTRSFVESPVGQAFAGLQKFLNGHAGSPIFGYFTYDLKNEIERLQSAHPDHVGFPALHFFEPEIFLAVDARFNVYGNVEKIGEILETQPPAFAGTLAAPVVRPTVSREEYLQTVRRIRQHIIEGDVYELNYCVEFNAVAVDLDPLALHRRLQQESPVPFGAFMKLDSKYLISASPERFMMRDGHRIVSQPIKGTMKRGRDEAEDELLKHRLLQSEKERAENLMIVDLVRNDIARSAITGSVHVDELFGIYSFRQVHQMISTVSGELRKDVSVVDAIRHAFPMGSMTGAPKIKAMELIEKYERTKRSLYSGAVGYFLPGGDFDFNVVIRSLQYNAENAYLSFMVGSAITYDSDAGQEYEECLLKASGLMRALGSELSG